MNINGSGWGYLRSLNSGGSLDGGLSDAALFLLSCRSLDSKLDSWSTDLGLGFLDDNSWGLDLYNSFSSAAALGAGGSSAGGAGSFSLTNSWGDSSDLSSNDHWCRCNLDLSTLQLD